MTTVNISRAKAQLSELIELLEEQEERIIICRYGKAVAELIPFRKKKRSEPDPALRDVRIACDLTEPTSREWDNA